MSMSTAKKYVNVPITYSSDDKLLDTRLFKEVGRVFENIKPSKQKSGLTGLRKILAEKKRK